MENAKKEFLTAVQELDDVLCAKIVYKDLSDFESHSCDKKLILKVGHTEKEMEAFLNELDFEYDSGYSIQYLFGTIWLKSNEAWLERGEYDGSEWWEYKERPEITKELL